MYQMINQMNQNLIKLIGHWVQNQYKGDQTLINILHNLMLVNHQMKTAFGGANSIFVSKLPKSYLKHFATVYELFDKYMTEKLKTIDGSGGYQASWSQIQS